MPVGDQDVPPSELRHEVRGDEIARSVQARFAPLRLELFQAVADRHVGADDEHHVRVAPVASIRHLVEDAPGREHAHDRGFAAAGRHLAGVTAKGPHPCRPCLFAGLVERHVDSLEEVRPRFGKEDDRLGGLELREEQPVASPVPVPVAQQLHGRPGDTALALERQRSPLGELGADSVDELQLNRDSGTLPILGRIASRRPVEIHGGPPALALLRRIVLRNSPIRLGLRERRVENRLGNLARIHGSTPKALQIASSFSTTSGWISSGSITRAIS